MSKSELPPRDAQSVGPGAAAAAGVRHDEMRRRLLLGAAAAPAILTLRGHSAFANGPDTFSGVMSGNLSHKNVDCQCHGGHGPDYWNNPVNQRHWPIAPTTLYTSGVGIRINPYPHATMLEALNRLDGVSDDHIHYVTAVLNAMTVSGYPYDVTGIRNLIFNYTNHLLPNNYYNGITLSDWLQENLEGL